MSEKTEAQGRNVVETERSDAIRNETAPFEPASFDAAAGFAGAAGFAQAETAEILNLLGDAESGGSCCGGSCCSA